MEEVDNKRRHVDSIERALFNSSRTPCYMLKMP
jgi:hypothetical protein